MSVRRRKPPTQEVDLEATAELPVIDFEASPEEQFSATDTFVAMAAPAAAGVSELTESLREIDSRLQRKSEQLRALEAQLAAAQEAEKASAQRATAAEQLLAVANSTLEARIAELAQARSAQTSHQQQLAGLQQTNEHLQRDFSHQARDLDELRARSERQGEALRHQQGVRQVFEGLIAEREHSLADIESRHAADVAATAVRVTAQQEEFRQREAQLEVAGQRAAVALAEVTQKFEAAERRVAELAGQVEAQAGQLSGQEAELARLRATDEVARAGAEVFEVQKARIRELENDHVAAQQRATRLDQDLRAAEEQIQRLEHDARANALLLGNLQQDIARLGHDDTGARPALKLVSPEQLPERFLVRCEGGMEVGHPLGRRTTIGRTPENDIQIDAAYISRHHAVILGNGQQCIIEDLNSTNGVLVNGRRVSRQALHDGDNVTIGKAVFRFQQPA